jgi:hypothetical protein
VHNRYGIGNICLYRCRGVVSTHDGVTRVTVAYEVWDFSASAPICLLRLSCSKLLVYKSPCSIHERLNKANILVIELENHRSP